MEEKKEEPKLTGFQKWLIAKYANSLMVALFVDLYADELGGAAKSEVMYRLRIRSLRAAANYATLFNEVQSRIYV